MNNLKTNGPMWLKICRCQYLHQPWEFPKFFQLYQAFFRTPCQKSLAELLKIMENLTVGADIGTCKISAQLVQWLLRNSHQKTVKTQLDLLRLNWIDCIDIYSNLLLLKLYIWCQCITRCWIKIQLAHYLLLLWRPARSWKHV